MRAIFHLHDPSTDFLKTIYESLPDTIVVNGDITRSLTREIINEASQVIMLGHGSPGGLFGRKGMLIDESTVECLKCHSNSIFIWCHASEFVYKHQLKGFATGMFISEDSEAHFCLKEGYGERGDEHSVTESNSLFALTVREALDEDLSIKDLSNYVKRWYAPDRTIHKNKNVLNYNAKLLTLIQ